MDNQDLVQFRVDSDLKSEGLSAFETLRQQAFDVPEMSLEEINAEIADVRKNRRK